MLFENIRCALRPFPIISETNQKCKKYTMIRKIERNVNEVKAIPKFDAF